MKSAFLDRNLAVISIVAVLVAISAVCRADVKPNSLLSDGAVLQQGAPVPVWGTAREGERVTVKFADQTVTATARDGRWRVRLKPLQAGGPFTMTITGDNTITITNLLVGEVWLCSGQSNMEFPLSRAANATDATNSAADPQLRLFTVLNPMKEKLSDSEFRLMQFVMKCVDFASMSFGIIELQNLS